MALAARKAECQDQGVSGIPPRCPAFPFLVEPDQGGGRTIVDINATAPLLGQDTVV